MELFPSSPYRDFYRLGYDKLSWESIINSIDTQSATKIGSNDNENEIMTKAIAVLMNLKHTPSMSIQSSSNYKTTIIPITRAVEDDLNSTRASSRGTRSRRNINFISNAQNHPLSVQKLDLTYWTKRAENQLVNLHRLNSGKWPKIVKLMKDKFGPFFTEQRCLHRWHQYINPNLNSRPLSKEEFDVLKEKVSAYPLPQYIRWSKIAKEMSYRPPHIIRKAYQILKENGEL
jgi:hypothetical protein